jgi:hypothetical protein
VAAGTFVPDVGSCRIHFDAFIIIAQLSGFNPRRQPMLRNLVVALAATAAVVVGGNAGAASMSAPAAMRTAADSLKMTENVQFFWGDHNYCWYDDGWNGPGWYWCDMYLQSGIGWGGGYGWHHWRGGHARSYYQGGRGGHVGGAVTRSGQGSRAVTRSSQGSRAVTRSSQGSRAVTRSSGGGGKGGGGGGKGGGGGGGKGDGKK